MSPTLLLLGSAVGLVIAILVMVELGHRLGRRRMERDAEGARAGTSAVEASAFGLFGLLIAFWFSGATNRFDDRRRLLVEEANNIGTAYLRIDLLPAEAQPGMRDRFRAYTDSRVQIYKKLPDLAAAKAELARSNGLQADLWAEAVKACQGSQAGTLLFLPAVNSMIDISASRTAAGLIMHPPPIILGLLILLSLGCALLVGHSMAASKTRNLLHTIAFACMVGMTFYVIIDVEYPRIGLIRVDEADQLLVDVRASMK